MSYERFKMDKIGDAQLTVTEGKFKGYSIVIRTVVSNVVFEDKYDELTKQPVFRITHHDSFIVIPPQVDIKKAMK